MVGLLVDKYIMNTEIGSLVEIGTNVHKNGELEAYMAPGLLYWGVGCFRIAAL